MKNKEHKWFPLLLAALVVLAIITNKMNNDTDDSAGTGNNSGGGSSNINIGAQQNRPDDDVLAAVPEELRDNYFLERKEKGCCKTLSGDVAVSVIMVSDSVGQWDAEATANLKTALEAHGQDIIAEAATHQVELSFRFHYYSAAMTGDICGGENTNDWQEGVLESAGLPALSELHNYLTKKYDSKEAPVVFVFNKSGRAFAVTGNSEHLVLFARNDFDAFQHELSHIFGAKDFYYPEEVKTLATATFPDSIMHTGETVDPLTAYLIGWTDTVSDSALQFLRDTNDISAEDVREEQKNQLVTGYGTRKYETGTYTGDLVRGERHGTGKMLYDNGGWYEGQWNYGAMSGSGTGKLIYNDGAASYEGEFKDGKRHGQGTYTYSNGAVYKGAWANGVKHGTGTMYYSSGGWYTGGWENDERVGAGQGKEIYNNGGVYEGEFYNGKRHGQGTYTYPDGGWVKGTWSNGSQTGAGYGKHYYDNGSYEGEFYDGSRHGQGTYMWSNGDKYTGQWANGGMSGYGTYTYANGTVKTGTWDNSKFVG